MKTHNTLRKFAGSNIPSPRTESVRLGGGLDQEVMSWDARPGLLRDSNNFEAAIDGGYRDITGYEAFDGNTAPSDATYTVIDVDTVITLNVGDTVTGVSSGETGVILAITAHPTTAGTFYLVLTKVTGSFTSLENLTVSAVVQARFAGTQSLSGATTAALHATYSNLAADNYRADIAAVPGSGSVTGVISFSDVVYAFRENAGATATDLYKSSGSGWTQVALGFELSFTQGGGTASYTIAEGDTITGATSTETAVVTRVMLESGSFQGGDAAGRFIYASQSGAFQAENIDVGANLNVATIGGDGSAITLPTGGRYEFDTGDFGQGLRIYGVNGVSRGFEFDGSVFCPIATGMATDTPTHVRVHKGHLFFSFSQSVQHSGTGRPYQFTAILGGSEINAGSPVTGFNTEPGSEGNSALGIYTKRRIFILYGSSALNWNLVPYRDEVGAIAYTIQQVGETMFLDGRGVTILKSAQEFGNFLHATASRKIQEYMDDNTTLAVDSTIARKKNQYRLFFSNKKGLYITFGQQGRIIGLMPIQYDHAVVCSTSEELTDGSEKMYFGSTDGFVYQMDKGTSFNGAPIQAWLATHFINSKSPRVDKRYLTTALEAKGDGGYSEFSFGYGLDYAGQDRQQGDLDSAALDYGATWDQFTWDRFVWDGYSLAPVRFVTTGRGENISFYITKNSDEFNPLEFTGLFFRWVALRQKT